MNLSEKRAQSVIVYYNYLPLYKKSGKTNDPFLRKMPNWQTDGLLDGWMDGWTDGLTKKQTDNSNFIDSSVGKASNAWAEA